MRSDYLPDDLKRLWKELASSPVEVPAHDLRREALRLRSGVRMRNWFVAAVCGMLIIAYAVFFARSSTNLERIGAVLSIAGAANVIVQFLKRPGRRIPDVSATETTRFYRAELERHCDFHRGKGTGSWLLPLLPGPILFNLGVALDQPGIAAIIALQMTAFLMLAAIVIPLNLRMARRYQRRLDALDGSIRE